MVWTIDGPQGNESAKIKYDIVPYTRGRVLDLGCGPFKTYNHFIGVDNGHHDHEFGWKNKADLIVDSCEKLDIVSTQSMDAVFSSHLLEHIKDTRKTLKEWWRVIKPGGHLVLYLPHKEFYPNIGEKGSNPDHKHDFLPQDIIEHMEHVGGWDLLENEERNEGYEYSFFQVYRKRNDKKHRIKKKPEGKTCAVVRYGGYGDLIMASSILPELKRQGYHVTLYTVPSGWETVKHDPHIDHVIIQDHNQVPNEELGYFWEIHKRKYDKWINLSESIEGTLLAMPGRTNHMWSDEIRRKHLNRNYLEWTHELADVPFAPAQKFYPSKEEKAFCLDEYKKHIPPENLVILWSLSGSSLHKTWPYLDDAIARLLVEVKKVSIVLVGDEACQVLEQGWEDEPRVVRRSGKWTMRQSMAFIDHCNMVVGTETGLVNAAGLHEVPKICFLSHSSQENLTKHWKNTVALEPKTACYPCHRMHPNRTPWAFCERDDHTGLAVCASSIMPDDFMKAFYYLQDKSWQQVAV
jgi:ADP-heptose:LPS heptosyltransferase/predicted SAM-dependent methyltransferase